MVHCPRCGHNFVPAKDIRTESSFELFHVYRDAYAKARGISNVAAKNELCVHFGVALEYEPGTFKPPRWPGLFVEVDKWIHFRKSTLAYTKAEMADLISRTEVAIVDAGGDIPV
jgi:hypothetical protein